MRHFTVLTLSLLVFGAFKADKPDTKKADCTLSCDISITAPINCNGGITSANADPLGGTAPFTFSWSTGSAASNASGLSAGTYSVLVTDNSGCTATASVNITQPAALNPGAVSVNIACNGENNGSVSSSPTGGTSPYNYFWTNGMGMYSYASSVAGLSAGTYTLYVNDANGCGSSASVVITQPSAPLNVTVPTFTNVTCFNGNNGLATSVVTGGTSPYTYSWSPGGQTTATATGLTSGMYSVYVTDNNGCNTMNTINIWQPGAINMTFNNIAPPDCIHADSDGVTQCNVTGGTGPFTYKWDDGSEVRTLTTSTISDLMPGTFTVTVTDYNGCSATTSIIISTLSLSIGNNGESCFGYNNASASANVTDGVGAYSYSWSTGATTNYINGLSVGTYSVTVTDGDGCTATASANITQPAAALGASLSSTNITCNALHNGTATVSGIAGTSPYHYWWSSPLFNSNATETGLTPGTYSVNITDFNGCNTTASISITQPSATLVGWITYTNVNCNGGSDGSGTAHAMGGTSPYTYSWSNGNTTSATTGLSSGNYTLTVTDANNCTSTSSAFIYQPSVLTVWIPTVSNVYCSNDNNGSISPGESGGTYPYTFSWSNGTLAPTNPYLTVGTYTITVTDFNGCTTSASAAITYAYLSPTVSVSARYNPEYSGVIDTLTATGADTYIWNTGATTTYIIESPITTGATTYTVTGTNTSSGCATATVYTLTVNADPTVSIAASHNPICAYTNDTLRASLSAASYSWSTGATTSQIIVNISSTTAYTLSTTFAGYPGMAVTNSLTLTVNYPPSAPGIDTLTADSNEFVAVHPGVSANYSWSASGFYGNFSGTSDTAYLLYWPINTTLTFYATSPINGCTSSSSIFIGHHIISNYIPPYNLPYPQPSKRGFYLEHCGNILDTFHIVWEQIKNYCLKNKITYVLMDGLNTTGGGNGVFYTNRVKIDTTQAKLLQSFIAMLKDSAGVQEVGTVCYGNYDYMAFSVGNYDIGNMLGSFVYWNLDTLPDHKIDVLSLDEETFWDASNSFAYDLHDFYTVHMPMLRAMYSAARECPTNNQRVEDYIGGLNPVTTRFRNDTATMMADSIGKYTDRILNSSYTEYPDDLLGRFAFHLHYLQFAQSRPYKNPIEIWPVLAAQDNVTYYCDSTDYLGDSMSILHKKPDYMEGRFFDSLRLGESLHKFDSTKFSTDTNFRVCGAMWWDYKCLTNYTFDTSTSGGIKFSVSVGPSKEWHEILPVWRPHPPITLAAKVDGGTAPYTYVWYDDTSRTIIQSGSSKTYIAHWPFYTRVSVLVVDAHGSTASDYLYIYQECHQAPLHNSTKRKNGADNPQLSTFNSQFKIYPNPANDKLFVEYQIADKTSQACLTIYDVLGSKVLSALLPPGQGLCTNNISNFAPGLYIYTIAVNGEIEKRGKIIIAH